MLVLNDDQKGKITLTVAQETVGLIDYQVEDDVMSVMHTEVYPEHRKKGYAEFLVQSFVNLTHLYRKKAGAVCPYAVRYFQAAGIKNHSEREAE